MPYAKGNQNGMISFAVSLPSFTTTEHWSFHRCNTHYEDTRTADIPSNSRANSNTVVTSQRTGRTYPHISVILRSLSYWHPTQFWQYVFVCDIPLWCANSKRREGKSNQLHLFVSCYYVYYAAYFVFSEMSSSDGIKLIAHAAFVNSTSPARRSENFLSSFIKDMFNLFFYSFVY